MGVSEYKVTRTLPKELEEILPSEEDIQKIIQRDENKVLIAYFSWVENAVQDNIFHVFQDDTANAKEDPRKWLKDTIH